MWLKTSKPVAPKVRLGEGPVSVSVPGAAAAASAAAPILITPCEPLPTPARALAALTVALFEMVNAPAPRLPTVSTPELVHEDPGPSTVAAPIAVAPEPEPIVPSVLETAPPFVMFSLPLPDAPTVSSPLLFHCDPAPLTVTKPTPVGSKPICASEFDTTAWLVICNVPLPVWPTRRNPVLFSCDPAPPIVTVPVLLAATPI